MQRWCGVLRRNRWQRALWVARKKAGLPLLERQNRFRQLGKTLQNLKHRLKHRRLDLVSAAMYKGALSREVERAAHLTHIEELEAKDDHKPEFEFKPGDVLRYTAAFLRRTGQMIGPGAERVFTVVPSPSGCELCATGRFVEIAGHVHVARIAVEHAETLAGRKARPSIHGERTAKECR